MDALRGSWQIKVAPDTQKYLAFATHKGTYLWERMPMGPKTTSATYQRNMNRSVQFILWRECATYFDDVITFTRGGFGGHLRALGRVFLLA